MTKEKAIEIFTSEVALFDDMLKRHPGWKDAEEYKEAMEFVIKELKKENLTVPIFISYKGSQQCEGFIDKSRMLIFDRWMTEDFAKHIGYEWEEVK